MTDRPRVRKRIVLALGGALFLVGGATLAQTAIRSAFNAPPPRGRLDAPPAADRGFVEAAHAAVALAPELRRLALERAEHAGVRGFAATPAGAALLPHLPPLEIPLTAEAQDTVALLAKLRGPAFDRALMDAEIQQRQALLGVSERQARSGANADLRQHAAQSLAAQRAELARAHTIAATVARGSVATRMPSAPAVTIGGPIVQQPAASQLAETVESAGNATADLNRRELDRIIRAGRN
jgi:predicted outer membrane protein